MFISLPQSCWTTLEIISRRAIAVIDSAEFSRNGWFSFADNL
ncbi:MAG: hypothetical protein ACYT04_39115 [Nostoc sp.]